MSISRRGFFSALATAAVGACVATKIPTAFLLAPVRRLAACEFLREKYNAHTKGLGVGSDKWPYAFLVGQELYDAYLSEIEPLSMIRTDGERIHVNALKFKAATLLAHPLTGLRGWDVMILTREQWTRALAKLEAGRPLEWVRNP